MCVIVDYTGKLAIRQFFWCTLCTLCIVVNRNYGIVP